MQDRWTLFAAKHGAPSAICAEFENLYHTSLQLPECDEKIFAFIRRKANADIDAFLSATKLHTTLKFYCQSVDLKEFWREIEKKEFSNETVPF